MDEDDLRVKKSAEFGLPRDLEGMSVENLQDYRIALKQELGRIEDALSHRQGVRAGAEALFKS